MISTPEPTRPDTMKMKATENKTTCGWKECDNDRCSRSRYCEYHKWVAAKRRAKEHERFDAYIDYIQGEGYEEPDLSELN